MRMAGALSHVMDVVRDILVIVMMSDPVEPHLIVATRTDDAVAVGEPADALVERRAAFRATHAADRAFASCNDRHPYLYLPAAASKGALNDFVSKIFDVPQP
jgi:hypothetical protein